MSALDRHVDHVIAHTGQNYDYELNQIFFEDLEIRKPDHFLEAAGSSAADTIGQVISKTDSLIADIHPDAFLILGDTNSCLGAIAAKRRKVPIFHMEAGNRSFDQRVPEEVNRKIVDHISDINMPYSTIGRDYLIREGFAPDRVIKTGSPMFEVLEYYKSKIQSSDVLDRLGLKEFDYFVVSSHREENVDSAVNFPKFVSLLNLIATKYGKRIIVSTHPRTRKKIESEGVVFNPLVELLKPLGFCDYVRLQQQSYCTLSDSGTINEESSILNFPALNTRDAHERPESNEEGVTIMTGMNPDRAMNALEVLESQGRGPSRTIQMVKDYSAPNVSEKVLRTILSYTDFVNRVVWQKPLPNENP